MSLAMAARMVAFLLDDNAVTASVFVAVRRATENERSVPVQRCIVP